MRRALLIRAVLAALFEGTYLWVAGDVFPAPPLHVVSYGQNYIISGRPQGGAHKDHRVCA